MKKPVYVVFGTTGEYGDTDEWIVGYTLHEGHAQLVADLYNTFADQIWNRTKLPEDDPRFIDRWHIGSHDELRKLHPDSKFHMDYTGTRYFYAEVEHLMDIYEYRRKSATKELVEPDFDDTVSIDTTTIIRRYDDEYESAGDVRQSGNPPRRTKPPGHTG